MVSREGAQLGSIAATPGSLRVEKSKKDLTVTCQKPGYQSVTISQSPRFVGTTFGNIILGGGIGAVVDAATGANYEYPNQVIVELPVDAARASALTRPVLPPPVSSPSAE